MNIPKLFTLIVAFPSLECSRVFVPIMIRLSVN